MLPTRHAYSHAIALSSAARAYFELGDPKYRTAIINAWRFLDVQRYASGGFGPDEQLITPGQGALYESLTRTKDHFETPCGSSLVICYERPATPAMATASSVSSTTHSWP